MSNYTEIRFKQSRALIFFVFTCLAIFACNTKRDKNKDSTEAGKNKFSTKIRFNKRVYDFGKINAGGKVRFKYEFKNVGNNPLQINDVYTSCGCTVPTYSHKPIMPGEESAISVEFDTENAMGVQKKAVTIVSNADPSTTEVYLVGEVISNKFFNPEKSAHL